MSKAKERTTTFSTARAATTARTATTYGPAIDTGWG